MFSPTTTFIFHSLFLFSSIVFVLHGDTISAHENIANIGAIVNVNSRIGKEQKISMEIAVQMINAKSSNKNNLVLHIRDSGGDPLQASTAANELIKEQQVQAIIGTETWKEASLVTGIANQAQVPFLSFSSPSMASELTSMRWPYLVKMATNDLKQLQCLASIIGSYKWCRVVVIYEEDYSTESGTLALLSDALRAVDSVIEHVSAFPLFSSLSNPKAYIREELKKLSNIPSRVFIILQSSLDLARHVINEAKHTSLMDKDSVWIATESVSSLLHTLNSTDLFSLRGIVGIKPHYSETTPNFLSFSSKFQNIFRSVYPQEGKPEPGIHALRAYDSVFTIASALDKLTNNTSKTLLENIMSIDLDGLGGKIQFEREELSSSMTYEIINVAGKSYTEIKYWSPDYGFSDDPISEGGSGDNKTTQVLGSRVYWPGGLDRVPFGWAMPSEAKPMIIGLPGRTAFAKFVKVTVGKDPTGFCIDVFKKAESLLGYSLPHTFQKFDGSYDDLVDQVPRKIFDAVVGDVTILANRSNYVEFTQPYAESGLTMVVPFISEERDWLFVKPFTPTMWLIVGIAFLHTMFVVWFMEHRSNSDFRGSWKNQLSTALWFTFSTLFFAHREKLRSNFTRVVMMVWLFVVFIVISSYQASLTSMLTVRRLEPTVTDIETLRRSNSPVGCDADSFVRNYLQQVLHFHPDNIIQIKSEYDYPREFKSGRIKAAFLEIPYQRAFVASYCKNYQVAGASYRFGGLGFVFPKGSPIARDFSEAFLKLSEDGTLDELERLWFDPSPECSKLENELKNQSLGLSNFWTLFLVTGVTSTVMLVAYIVQLCIRFRRHFVLPIGTSAPGNNSFWNGIKRLGTYFNNNRLHPEPVSADEKDVEMLLASTGEYLTVSNSSRHLQSTPMTEKEFPKTYIVEKDTRERVLRIANSLPTLRRPGHVFPHEDSKWQHIPNST
ncbi:hypothetical protein ACHQM5_002860 [Ranunculus cassubicifolius]